MHCFGEMPVNIGIRVSQPSHLFYVHVLGLGVNSNMMPGMLASLAVFTGGEITPLFVQIGLLPSQC